MLTTPTHISITLVPVDLDPLASEVDLAHVRIDERDHHVFTVAGDDEHIVRPDLEQSID